MSTVAFGKRRISCTNCRGKGCRKPRGGTIPRIMTEKSIIFFNCPEAKELKTRRSAKGGVSCGISSEKKKGEGFPRWGEESPLRTNRQRWTGIGGTNEENGGIPQTSFAEGGEKVHLRTFPNHSELSTTNPLARGRGHKREATGTSVLRVEGHGNVKILGRLLRESRTTSIKNWG